MAANERIAPRGPRRDVKVETGAMAHRFGEQPCGAQGEEEDAGHLGAPESGNGRRAGGASAGASRGAGSFDPARRQLEIERRLRAGDHAGALPLLRSLAAYVPDQPEIEYVTAMVALRQGRFHEAAELLAKRAPAPARAAEHLFTLGLCHWALDAPGAARYAFERALEIEPTHEASLRFVSELLAREGEIEALERLHAEAAARGVDPARLCPPDAAERSVAARRLAQSYRQALGAQLVARWCDPETRRPVRASIVLTATAEPAPLVRTLRQLMQLAEPLWPAEPIVLAPPEASWIEQAQPQWGERVRVVRVERARAGALRNAALAHARGAYLCFLAPDLEPAPGWLPALLEPMERDRGVALTGARILDARGRLAEAGLAVFRSAQVHRYGCGHDPRAAEFSFLREVHAVSDRAFAVRREAFEQLGGFADGFETPLYETLDLALRLTQRLGLRVLYEPHALAVEHAQTPQRGLVLEAPAGDVARLRERHPELERFEPPRIEALLCAAQRNRNPRTLVIAARMPERAHGHEAQRVVGQLETLRRAGAAPSLLALDPRDPGRMAPLLAARGIRVLPFTAGEAKTLEARLRTRLEELAPYRFERIVSFVPRIEALIREASAGWSPRPQIARLYASA